MVSQKVHGKIIFVSSLLGYASFAGYTNYSPGKYALRGMSSQLLSPFLLLTLLSFFLFNASWNFSTQLSSYRKTNDQD
jgi:3-dehydrosphinganine reductase